MNFTKISAYVKDWIRTQPNTREEAYSYWLLYEVQKHRPNIHSYAFNTRHEAKIGADWAWWFICDGDGYLQSRYQLFHFLVQAKKLLPSRDNYNNMNRTNQYGSQMETLITTADTYNAIPLYVFYSANSPDAKLQQRCWEYAGQKIMEEYRAGLNPASLLTRSWRDKNNGVYLSLARSCYQIIYGHAKKYISEKKLLTLSVGLSAFDHLATSDILRGLSLLNGRLNKENFPQKGYFGAQRDFPNYMKQYINHLDNSNYANMQGELSWEEFSAELPPVEGIIVFDLRNKP